MEREREFAKGFDTSIFLPVRDVRPTAFHLLHGGGAAQGMCPFM